MEQKLISFLENYEKTLTDKKIIVAVSGGPDSICLLHILNEWKERLHLTLVAVTINHQLRAEAEADVKYVESLCDRWRIPFITETIDVARYEAEHKVSMQVAARDLRYDVFARLMEEEQADYLALGHHGDDQIETLVMGLMRSTTLGGLTGIPFTRPFATGAIIRPLLALTKADIETYCKHHQLTPRIDLSNEDTTYTRNYVRKRIVPQMKEKNESLHVTAQQLSRTLHEDEMYLQTVAKEAFDTIAEYDVATEEMKVKISQLRTYAIPLQRRIYRLILDYLYESLPPQLSYAHEEIFLSLIKEETNNKRLHFPAQLMVEVVYDHIAFYFEKEKAQPFTISVEKIPATIPLPNGHRLEITYTKDIARKEAPNEYICALSQVRLPLYIRTRRPGDRMRYRGLNGSKKIKDILIDEKIPPQKRDHIPIVTDATDEILWLVGVRKGVRFKDMDEENVALSFIYKT